MCMKSYGALDSLLSLILISPRQFHHMSKSFIIIDTCILGAFMFVFFWSSVWFWVIIYIWEVDFIHWKALLKFAWIFVILMAEQSDLLVWRSELSSQYVGWWSEKACWTETMGWTYQQWPGMILVISMPIFFLFFLGL